MGQGVTARTPPALARAVSLPPLSSSPPATHAAVQKWLQQRTLSEAGLHMV
jgi:hypothetical protein